MKKYFVIGNPINHSLSPKLHNHWLEQNKINAVYEKRELSSDEIGNLILEIKNSLKIKGLKMGRIVQRPIDELVKFHKKLLEKDNFRKY